MSSTKITEFDLDPNMNMAKESTSQEILGKFTEIGLGSSAQTKKFTNVTSGQLSTTEVSITGSGKLTLFNYSSNYPATMTVMLDGVELPEFTIRNGDSGGLPIVYLYFENSVKFTASGANLTTAHYIVQT